MNRALLVVVTACTIAAAGTGSDSLPHTFTAGDTARASEVNENLLYLLDRINAAELRMDSLNDAAEARIDSLGQVTTGLEDSIAGVRALAESYQDSLGELQTLLVDSIDRARALTMLPVGSIIGSMMGPDDFAAALGADSANWRLADGSESTTEYLLATQDANIPDLRGLFLRGLNAGRSDGRQDPNGGSRSAGGYQADEFESHSHTLAGNMVTGNGGLFSGGSYGAVSETFGSAGGAETRAKNAAVYWYIKVK